MPDQTLPPSELRTDVTQRDKWLELRDLLAHVDDTRKADLLGSWAKAIRRSVVEMIDQAQLGHIGGDFSAADILTTLFLAVVNVHPEEPRWPDRDRVILSKGHSCASYYSALAFSGFFSPSRLSDFMAPLSPLSGHPNRNAVPGVETNTGALGHGLPVAVGIAIGAKLAHRPFRTFVLTGDGELQEGSNWEALMAGSHHALDNLMLIVDRNRLQQGARTEQTTALDPLDAKLASFGWEVRVTDGHDYSALRESMRPATSDSPVAVIANTIKGKGVSFIEDRVEWHHRVPSPDQVALALKELA